MAMVKGVCSAAGVAMLTCALMLAAPSAAAGQPATKPDPSSEKERLKQEAKDLFKQPQSTPAQGTSPGAAAKGWAVVIAAFRGEQRDQAAAVMLAKVRTDGGLPDAYASRRHEAVVVAVGDFPTPDDDAAKKELTRIQQIEIGGVRPYASAMLAPPLEWKMAGSMPQYNLARARETHGDRAMYTLQVGAYGRMDLKGVPNVEDLAEARKAAEQAAVKLRQDGELAFYYHGPTLSMVTVGVFDTNDFDPQTPSFKSSRLRETQKRNPYNLYNGEGVRVKVKGQQAQIQPSNLVEIPKK